MTPTEPSTGHPATTGLAPGWIDGPARWLERQPVLDIAAERLAALARRVVPSGRLGEELRGRSLGHAVHPAMTDVPIGFWTSAVTLDLFGGRASRRAADILLALGTVTAVPTALAGLTDWLRVGPADRRVGVVHAAGNAAAVLLFARSSAMRVRGHRVRGVSLALAGGAVATLAGYLGGHLASRVMGATAPQAHLRAAALVVSAPVDPGVPGDPAPGRPWPRASGDDMA